MTRGALARSLARYQSEYMRGNFPIVDEIVDENQGVSRLSGPNTDARASKASRGKLSVSPECTDSKLVS
jgi:hypothetical protein